MKNCLFRNSANIVSLFRAAVTIYLLLLFKVDIKISVFLGLTIFIFILDGVDGILARQLKICSLTGSFLDVLSDRIIEFSYILFFYSYDIIPLWFPFLFYLRILFSDISRFYAYSINHVTPTGIILNEKSRSIVLSSFSRTTYGLIKLVLFCSLYFQLKGHVFWNFELINEILLINVLVFSYMRAIPIVGKYFPLLIKSKKTFEFVKSSLLQFINPKEYLFGSLNVYQILFELSLTAYFFFAIVYK